MASSSSLLSLLLLSIPLLLSSAFPLPFSNLAGELPQQELPATATAVLAPILTDLGFQELSMAATSLSSPILSSPWSSPVTLFAPSDDSVRSCGLSCSPARLLSEHLVTGVFSGVYLSKLSSGTKLETATSNRCLTITSTAGSDGGSNSTVKIFVDGVEITRPDLFNDGTIVIHGIQGFIAPLSPFSCSSDRSAPEISRSSNESNAIAIALLRDAIVHLRTGGYDILALAMRIKSAELVGLQNMTVFALDDRSIFGGGHSYVAEVRFHVVPNQLLMHSDLVKLPQGTVIPTLVRGQHLVVTQGRIAEPFGSGLRINYVPIKAADVVHNTKIVVHSLFFPFPHLYLVDQLYAAAEDSDAARAATCGVLASPGDCKMAPTPSAAASLTFDLYHYGDEIYERAAFGASDSKIKAFQHIFQLLFVFVFLC